MNASRDNEQKAIEDARKDLRATWTAIQVLVLRKARLGLITKEERRALSNAFDKVLVQAGLQLTDTSRVSNSVIRQAIYEMRVKVVELHPEWLSEVTALTAKNRGIDPK